MGFPLLNTILLIDDDRINNYLNSRLILKSKLCNKLEVAYNGQEGLDLLKQKLNDNTTLPQLILLDINMPVMDGFEFMDKFNVLPCNHIKVVLLTTSSNPADIKKFEASGACGYINKPLTEEKLRTMLAENFG